MLLMQYSVTNGFLVRLRAFVLTAAIAVGLASIITSRPGFTEESAAYEIEVGDVTVKVGEHALMHATLRIRGGYRILHSYNNRVIKLSSEDDGVAFDQEMVRATVEDGALLFTVGLRATKPGKHPINGLFRVGYIHGTDEMAMVSLRLIASVTGTE
jgi:hypothetical protein